MIKFSKLELLAVALAAFVGLVVLPCLNAFVPPSSGFHVTTFSLSLYGKYLTYAVLALGVNLLWGYTGLLSLGQCLFFSLGGYCLGMNMMMNISRLGQYHEAIPDFMVFLEFPARYPETGGLPPHWMPFKHFWFAGLMVVLVPAAVAALFGWLAFRSRIKGVYFSILSQALTYAACLMFFRNDFTFGGNNGLTDFKFLLGTPSLEAGEIARPADFIAKLSEGRDGVSKHLWSQIPEPSQKRLKELADANQGAAGEVLLGAELNKILATGLIYEERRFSEVALAPEIKRRLGQNPRDTGMLNLNRDLLESAFPQDVARWEGSDGAPRRSPALEP